MGRNKNGMGNRRLKEFICTIHGHELRGQGMKVEGQGGGRIKGQIGKTVIA